MRTFKPNKGYLTNKRTSSRSGTKASRKAIGFTSLQPAVPTKHTLQRYRERGPLYTPMTHKQEEGKRKAIAVMYSYTPIRCEHTLCSKRSKSMILSKVKRTNHSAKISRLPMPRSKLSSRYGYLLKLSKSNEASKKMNLGPARKGIQDTLALISESLPVLTKIEIEPNM